MEQVWTYCSSNFPLPSIARLKSKRINKYLKKQKWKKQASIYEWNINRKTYQSGLYLLYRKAYQGKVKSLLIYSLGDISRNVYEQIEFMKDMQELKIPVFCLKTKQYLKEEKN